MTEKLQAPPCLEKGPDVGNPRKYFVNSFHISGVNSIIHARFFIDQKKILFFPALQNRTGT
jgi:hypothetical protein